MFPIQGEDLRENLVGAVRRFLKLEVNALLNYAPPHGSYATQVAYLEKLLAFFVKLSRARSPCFLCTPI